MPEHRFHRHVTDITYRTIPADLACSDCGAIICRVLIPVEPRPGWLTRYACMLTRGHEPERHEHPEIRENWRFA